MSSTIEQQYGGTTGRDFVATGTIDAAGVFVSLRSDGTVEQTKIATPAVAAGTSYQYAAAISGLRSHVASNDNGTIVVTYFNSGSCFAVAGTVSGTVITFGTPVTVGSGVNTAAISYDPVQNIFIVGWVSSDSPQRANVRALSVSGTTITLGAGTTSLNGTSDASYIKRIVYVSSQAKHVAVFEDQTGTFEVRAIAITATGTTLSIGSSIAFFSGTVSILADAFYDVVSDKVLVLVRTTSFALQVQMLTLAGTTLSLAGTATTVFTSSPSQRGPNASGVSIGNGKVVIANDVNTVGNVLVVVGTISGTTISFGATTALYTGQGLMSLSYSPSIDKVTYTYRDPGDNFIKFRLCTVTGTTVTVGSDVAIYSDTNYYVSTNFDHGLDKLIVTRVSQANVGNAVIVDPEAGSTNLLTWIGVAQAAATNGQTVTVKLPGEIDENQIGLVTGSDYYLTENGRLVTVKPNPSVGKIGTALTSTTLQLWKNGE